MNEKQVNDDEVMEKRAKAINDVPSLTEVSQARNNERLLIEALVDPASDLHACQHVSHSIKATRGDAGEKQTHHFELGVLAGESLQTFRGGDLHQNTVRSYERESIEETHQVNENDPLLRDTLFHQDFDRLDCRAASSYTRIAAVSVTTRLEGAKHAPSMGSRSRTYRSLISGGNCEGEVITWPAKVVRDSYF